jgi:general secretion pathway protein D
MEKRSKPAAARSPHVFKIGLGLVCCLVLFGTGPYVSAQEPKSPVPPVRRPPATPDQVRNQHTQRRPDSMEGESRSPAQSPSPNPAPAPVSGSTQEGKAPKKAVVEDRNSFTINFKDVELEQIIKTFSDITGKNFILEQIPKGKITIVSPVKIPKNQALQVFQAILNLNSYNMVPTSISNLYRIVPLAETPKSNLPIFLPNENAPSPVENYIIKFIPLKYMDVQEATQLVQPLLSKESASVVAYQTTNTLIIVDTALNIARITRVLAALDVPSQEPEMEIVYMHNSSAAEVAAVLGQIFAEAGGKSGGKATATAIKAPASGKAPAGAPPAPGAANPQGTTTTGNAAVKIIPEQRLNALIVIAQRDLLEQVKKIISLLDVQGGDKGVIHVYYCKHAVAKQLAGTLASLGGSGSSGGFRQSTGGSTSSSRTSDLGMGSGSFGSSFGAGYGAGTMGGSSMASRSSSMANTGGATTANLSGGLFEGEIKITADETINSLIIIASPRDYDLLKKVIEQLDIPRRQVFVEAVLLQIDFDQTRNLGTAMHAGSSLPNNGLVVAGSEGTLNSLGLASLASTGAKLPSGLTVGAFGGPITIPGTQITIPSAGVLLNMLASDSNVNVLSTPNILTTDNEDAEIQVGERIPMPSGQSISSGVSSVSVTREEVGIKLKLTPQICESGTIRMEIAVEISAAAPSPQGVDPNTWGTTTTLKTANTVVIVKDTQTIVIGGLMEDRRNADVTRIPLIGDIPVLGWAFKSADRQRKKSNLIILITPHIVRSDEEVNNMRKRYQRDYDSFIDESFGEMEQKWDSYFQSQYQTEFKKAQPRTEVDLTGDKPKVIEINPNTIEVQPESGATPQTKPQTNPQDNSTVLNPESQPPTQGQGAKPQPAPAEPKKKWWQTKTKNDQQAPKKTKAKK